VGTGFAGTEYLEDSKLHCSCLCPHPCSYNELVPFRSGPFIQYCSAETNCKNVLLLTSMRQTQAWKFGFLQCYSGKHWSQILPESKNQNSVGRTSDSCKRDIERWRDQTRVGSLLECFLPQAVIYCTLDFEHSVLLLVSALVFFFLGKLFSTERGI